MIAIYLGASAVIFSAGWQINAWRLGNAFAIERAELVESNGTLARAISEQNAAIAIQKRETELAKAAGARAQREAQGAQRELAARSEAVGRLTGSCEQVVRDGWGRL